VASPKKTQLVERISYAEEALRNLKDQLHELYVHFEEEHQRVSEELKLLVAREEEIDEETFTMVDAFLEDAWTRAMSARNNLKDLDDDLDNCDRIMSALIAELTKKKSRA
jgi:hypothetical protein